VPVTWEQIPPVVVQAVLAAEDDRFFEHPGVDWQGIARALVVAATTMEASQGGSTLTQQLVRTTLITKEKQLRRKLREVFLALSLENELSKQEIFTLFVNTQFLGQRSYGFAAASETYFGKSLGEVDASEAALLAAVPKDPSRYDPVASPREARARRNLILRLLVDQGKISPRDALAASAAPLPKPDTMQPPSVNTPVAPYFANYVKQQLIDQYGAAKVFGGGYRVTTSIDLALQKAARRASGVDKGMEGYVK